MLALSQINLQNISPEISEAFSNLSNKERLENDQVICTELQTLNQISKSIKIYEEKLKKLKNLPRNSIEELKEEMLPKEIEAKAIRKGIVDTYKQIVQKQSPQIQLDISPYIQALNKKGDFNDLISYVCDRKLKELSKQENLVKVNVLGRLEKYKIIEIEEDKGFTQGVFGFILSDFLRKTLQENYPSIFQESRQSQEEFEARLAKTTQNLTRSKEVVREIYKQIYASGWEPYVTSCINEIKKELNLK